MPNLILAENRALGVKWLADNASKDDAVRRTQTEIDYDPHSGLPGWRVIVHENHVRGTRCNDGDGIFIIGSIAPNLLTTAQECFATTEGGAPAPAVISKTWLKKQELIQQMQDLEKEEKLQLQLATLQLEGAAILGSNVDVDPKTRTFTIRINGRFE